MPEFNGSFVEADEIEMRPLLAESARALSDPLHVDEIASITVHGDTVRPYSISRKRMADDSSDHRRRCTCGSRDFNRVRVLQRSGEFYETEFVACRSCGVMYHWPARDRMELTPERRAFLKRTGWL